MITSGDDIPTTSFTVSGSRIENITITETEDDWTVTPSNPNIGDTVTITYVGDPDVPATKNGEFKISAEATTGSVLSTTEYTNDLKLVIRPKPASVSTAPTSVTLTTITSGETSVSKPVNAFW